MIQNSSKSCDLINILTDINIAPEWRPLADKCADYYDCNQLTATEIAEREEKGLPPLITNLVKPVIDTVLGMEEKTRTDWKVNVEAGEDEQTDELAEALSAKLHLAEKESQADRACSEAYASMVKTGIGWVEVSRDNNPFHSPYRVKSVHRNEIDFDWRSREFDLSDARFLVRRKWYDNDVLAAMFPACADKIKQVSGSWNLWDNQFTYAGDTGLAQGSDIQRSGTLEESEWIDMGRNRTCLFEVWYRKYEAAHIISVMGRTVEFNPKNPIHMQLYQSDLVEVKSTVIGRARQAYWVGPYLLVDRPTPYSHNNFPYVPFIGFREDLTGIPYGLVRPMLSPQDEFNARRAKMYELLSLRRVITDADAVVDHNKAAREIASPDAYIILNPRKKLDSKFIVQKNGTLAKDQFQVMEDSATNINKAAGIQQTMMNPAATSGLAKQVDIEQGATTLAEINGNYRNARINVGEMLLGLIKEDIGGNRLSVRIGEGKARKVVELNTPKVQNGLNILGNDVQRAMSKVTLDSVPATATYRQQLASQLIEMTKALPPQIQGLIIDFVIESSDLPKRHEIADRIRKSLNIQQGEDGQEPTPLEQQLQQQLQQVQEQAKAAIGELQQELSDSETKLKQEQAKGLDIKRNIEEIKLEEAKQKLETTATPGDNEHITDMKLNMLAEQVGKLTKIIESNQQ